MLHQLCRLFILAAAELLAQESSNPVQSLHAEAQQILALPAAEQDLIRLVQIDLSLSDEKNPTSLETCRTIMRALAVSENETAMEHVRAIFENDPERRDLAAWALSQSTTLRPADLQDWRYMVRSLNVVSGDDAASVMKALIRFRVRANKPQWVRQVILIGLQMTPEQQPAAISLLKHWTGMPKGKDNWRLSDYQTWFAKEHPEHPEAVLPVDSTTRKWNLNTLEAEIQHLESTPELVAAGEKVYEKAGCQKCHRRSQLGQAFGPDLTSLGWRRQKKEILQAILFPSHDLNEEYPSVSVVLKDGRILNGVLSTGAEGMMSVVSNTAVREEFPRTEIENIINQKISNMPEGTLEPLTLDEIKALFAYLTSVDGVPKPHGDELE